MNYYPLIRGRQYDLLALKEAVEKDALSPHVLPVIEPVKDLPALTAVAKAFTARKHLLFVVQNPQVGRYGLLASPVHRAALSPWVRSARYFDGQTGALIIAETLAQVVALPKGQASLIPAGARFRRLHLKHAAYLEDHTPTRERTEDYRLVQREFYQYPQKTLPGSGFADYPLATRHYDERGYPQRALSLHLLFEQHDQLWVQHFTSVNNEDFSRPQDKFFEAAAPLPAWLTAHPKAATPALRELIELAAARHFPGAGVLRKLQLRHFLSVMGHYLDTSF